MGLSRTDRLLFLSSGLLLAAVGLRLGWAALSGGAEALPPFDPRRVTAVSVDGPGWSLEVSRSGAGWAQGDGGEVETAPLDRLVEAWSPGYELGAAVEVPAGELDGARRLRITAAEGPLVDLLIGRELSGGRCTLARPDGSAAWRAVAPCGAGLPGSAEGWR